MNVYYICDICLECDYTTDIKKRILQLFRLEHLGITRMKALMESFVFWWKKEENLKIQLNFAKDIPLATRLLLQNVNLEGEVKIAWFGLHVNLAGLMYLLNNSGQLQQKA